MATQKPSKPNVTLPNNFGGVKTPYTQAQIDNGYQEAVPQVVDGGNVNYEKDGIFQKLKYAESIADVINGTPVKKVVEVDANNNFDYSRIGVYAYETTRTFSKDEISVSVESDGQVALYRSLANNNKGNSLKNGNFWEQISLGGGLEIGDIGFAPLGIDETQNKRRYLNGQVISQAQFVSFTNKIKSAIELYPSLATTETNWQATVTNSKLGQCGKFVIDDTAGTIRLPKVVNVNGLTDLSLMGGIKAESLPNIKGGNSSNQNSLISPVNSAVGNYGAVSIIGNADGRNRTQIGGEAGVLKRAVIDASLSSSTYQDNAPVQQEAVQYPYFIQVATGSEESVDVSTEIQLNNPFFFGMHIWSDTAISNASWLISNGSYHSGATYVDFYQWLLKIHNGTLTVDGVSVKAYGASGITDYDYVINTANTTFRLPVKVKLASGNAVVGNNFTGFDIYNNSGILTGSNRLLEASSTRQIYYSGDSIGDYGKVGITTDPTKSGIETSSQGLKLYFYVGETIQDANVIAASNALTDIANIGSRTHIVETYSNGTSWYRIWSDGWCEQGGYSTSSNVIITLLKTYANTNYTITLGKAYNIETNTRFPNIVSTTKTTAQFKVTGTFNNTTGTDCYFYWETKGYIA